MKKEIVEKVEPVAMATKEDLVFALERISNLQGQMISLQKSFIKVANEINLLKMDVQMIEENLGMIKGGK